MTLGTIERCFACDGIKRDGQRSPNCNGGCVIKEVLHTVERCPGCSKTDLEYATAYNFVCTNKWHEDRTRASLQSVLPTVDGSLSNKVYDTPAKRDCSNSPCPYCLAIDNKEASRLCNDACNRNGQTQLRTLNGDMMAWLSVFTSVLQLAERDHTDGPAWRPSKDIAEQIKLSHAEPYQLVLISSIYRTYRFKLGKG